jgi:hypothetical protein
MNTDRAFWKDPIFLECFERSRRINTEIYTEKIESVFQKNKKWLLETLAAIGAFEIAYRLWQRDKVKRDVLKFGEVDDLEAAITTSSQYDLDKESMRLIDDDIDLNSFIPGSRWDVAHKKFLKEQYLRKTLSTGGVSLNNEESDVLTSKQVQSVASSDFLLFVRESILKNIEQIEEEGVKGLQLAMFNLITDIVNKPGRVSKSNAFLINCLETCIEHHLPFLGEFVGQHSNTLTDLRKGDSHKLNTVCCICNNKLNRKRKGAQCNQKESRKCYKKSLLESRAVSKEAITFLSKNICEKVGCGRRASLDFIHKIEGLNRQFCSGRCYMAYRKALQRSRD